MNAAPKYDVWIDGLTAAEYARVSDALIAGGTIRPGIEMHVTVSAPEMPKPIYGPGILPCSTDLAANAVTSNTIVANSNAETLDAGLRRAARLPADPAADPAGWYPPERTPAYIATLIRDLPRNSLVVLVGGSYSLTVAMYDDLVDLIDAASISRQVRANGKQRTVLNTGTTIMPDPGSGAPAAHLVIVTDRAERFTARTATRAALRANANAAQIIAMGEGSADA